MSRFTRMFAMLAAVLCALAGVSVYLTSLASAATTGTPHETFAANVKPGAAVHTMHTSFSLIPDSGDSGNNWGLDTYSETLTVTRGAQVSVGLCGGGIHCYSYSYNISDSGTTQTQAGQVSPGCNGTNCSTVLDVTENAAFAGGTRTGQFYSSYASYYTSKVPTSVNGNGTEPSPNPGTPAWVEQGSPSPYKSAGTDGNWGWSYTVAKGGDSQCPGGMWKWEDTYLNSSGQGNVLAPDKADCAAQS